MHFGTGKSRTCCVAGVVQHARYGRHAERDRRDTQLSLLCYVYKVMITVIRLSLKLFTNLLEYILILFILFDVNKQDVCD